MGPGVVILGLGALGLMLMSIAGGKKGATQPAPGGGFPGGGAVVPPGASLDQIRQQITNMVISAGQSSDPAVVDAAAQQIEAMTPSLPFELQGFARQASQSLRAQAAALRADRGAKGPPIVSTPPFVPPVVQPPVTTPPQPSPGGGFDWAAFINEKLMSAGIATDPSVLESAAATIEANIPQMPPDLQARARQAVTALRNQAQALRNPPPVSVPPPVIAPPNPAPDPILSGRAQLAQAVTNELYFSGSQPTKRYKEDRALVSSYQRQEGLTDDGMYGVGTGLSMVKYGVVPARPYYFSRDASKTSRDKAEWKRVMNQMAQSDPARRSQWLEAAQVDQL